MATQRTHSNEHSHNKQNAKIQAANIHGAGDHSDVPGSDRGASGDGVILSGIGNIASSIQAELVPTPEQQIQLLKEQLKAMRDKNEALSLRVRDSRDEIDQANRYIRRLEQEKSRMQKTITGLKNESSALQRELANIRSKDESDTISPSEVFDKLDNLNEEIFKAAALLGAAIIPVHYPRNLKTPAATSLNRILGSNLVALLFAESRKKLPRVNPLLIQIVLQIFLAGFCHPLINKWYPEDLEKSRALEVIYDNIGLTEEQVVAGRWRALMRSRLAVHPESWEADFFKSLDKLLVVAGWKIVSEADREGFRQKVKSIFKAVEDIRSALGEKVMSEDLQVYWIGGGYQFNGDYMEDAYGDSNSAPPSQKAPPEVLLGTVGLGLSMASKDLPRTANGRPQFTNVVSIKVVLESALRKAPEKTRTKNRRKSNESHEGDSSKAYVIDSADAEQSAKYRLPSLVPALMLPDHDEQALV